MFKAGIGWKRGQVGVSRWVFLGFMPVVVVLALATHLDQYALAVKKLLPAHFHPQWTHDRLAGLASGLERI